MTRQLIRTFLTAAVVLLLMAIAAPASAQNGALSGRVVFDNGRPAAGVDIVLDFVGDMKRQVKTTTDKDGMWVRPGIPAGGGTWTITAKKGDLVGTLAGITIKVDENQKVPDIVIQSAAARTGAKPATVSKEAAAAAAKKQAETDKLLTDVNAAIKAGNDEEAITKLNALVATTDKCASCHAKLGELLLKKNDVAAAEASFLKAIDLDPAMPAPYSHLATIYNQQRKFDEATKMSAKVAELTASAGGTEDASTVFNQGVIFWNQSKVAEARAQWLKATQLDPKMADAFYWLGISNFSESKTADAKAAFEMYLKLAPTGQYADTAKTILATIK